MKGVLTIALALGLVGCAHQQPILSPQKTETITWHRVSAYVEAQNICGKKLGFPMKVDVLLRIGGCFWKEEGVCHVVAVDCEECLKDLGHEVKHCFDGYFHDGRHVNRQEYFASKEKRNAH